MARRRLRPIDRERGTVLVVALVAVGALAILSLACLHMAATVTRSENGRVDRSRAFYSAEAGLSEAYAALSIGKTGAIGSADKPAIFGDGLFWVEATEVGDDRVELVSHGMLGSGVATLALVLEKQEVLVASLGVFAAEELDVPPGTLIDGYDSSLGGYADQAAEGTWFTNQGRIGTNDNATVTGTKAAPTLLNGDVTPGPSSTVTVTGEATVTGATRPRPAAVALPPVDAPDWPLVPGVTPSGPIPMVVLPGKHGIEYIHVEAGAEVLVQGPAEVVLEGLRVESGGRLELDATQGRIDLYVTSYLDLQPGAIVETTEDDPSQVTIQVAGDVPVGLRNGGSFHGVVYAPEAEVAVGRDFELFGALTARSLQIGGGARLHFDADLLSDAAGDAALPTVLSWRILELEELTGPDSSNPFAFLGVDKATLDPPAESHADQQIAISYEDLAGTDQTYTGWESGFDWTDVKTVYSLSRDDEPVVKGTEATQPSAADQALLDAIDATPPMTSSDLKTLLVSNSPLSEDVQVAAILASPAMWPSDLKDVLLNNSPTTPTVLLTAIDSGMLGSSELKDVLLASSPLPPAVLAAAENRTPPMVPSDLASVQAAQ